MIKIHEKKKIPFAIICKNKNKKEKIFSYITNMIFNIFLSHVRKITKGSIIIILKKILSNLLSNHLSLMENNYLPWEIDFCLSWNCRVWEKLHGRNNKK